MRYTFPKAEHLCLQREIDALFQGKSRATTVYPLRAVVQTVVHGGHGPRVKVLVSVSKRKLRRAVDRNRAKRQIREAYRLNKHLLLEGLPEGMGVHLAFIWLTDAGQSSRFVHRRMTTLLHLIVERVLRLPASEGHAVADESTDGGAIGHADGHIPKVTPPAVEPTVLTP